MQVVGDVIKFCTSVLMIKITLFGFDVSLWQVFAFGCVASIVMFLFYRIFD